MGKYFGTDGITGTVGKELTVDLALKVGKALSYFEEKDSYRESQRQHIRRLF